MTDGVDSLPDAAVVDVLEQFLPFLPPLCGFASRSEIKIKFIKNFFKGIIEFYYFYVVLDVQLFRHLMLHALDLKKFSC